MASLETRVEPLVKAEHIAQTRRDRAAARRTRQTSERGIFLPHSGQISSRFGQAAAWSYQHMTTHTHTHTHTHTSVTLQLDTCLHRLHHCHHK